MTSKLNINWLNKCRCGNRMHTVETVRGSHVRLFEDDAVKCNSCGRKGVIQTCDGIATVLWETDEERAEGVSMTSKLTREQTQQIIDAADAVITALAGTNDEVHKDDTDKMVRLWDDLNDRYAPPEVVRDLAVFRLAAMDSEPYGFTDGDQRGMIYEPQYADRLNEPLPVYRHAQPAPEHEQVRREHAEWSHATFGNVGPVGPLKHLSKEALEAAAEPGDLSEWADMQFLLWDAQRRAGITDEQITQSMIEKLAVNKLREWPEPKDGEPRLHIKEQSAPVMPNFKKLARELVENLVDCGGLDAGVKGKYLKWTEKTCRAALLNGGKS